ncbi:uncharacterized protein [Oscarella lobularis]|uniref:uncharacterized protein n=1 Tax=Oscarella lobularis TaxID=121494 RepID=UPI00331416A3
MVRFECQQGPASFIAKDLDHIRQILKSYETDMESSETKVESDLLAARIEIQSLWKTIEELQMKLEAKDEANETRNDPSKETSRARLKEAIKATAKGYRDIVHDVLGYKIELLPDSGMCALRSIYAEKPDDVVKLKVRVYKFLGISSQPLLCLFRFKAMCF